MLMLMKRQFGEWADMGEQLLFLTIFGVFAVEFAGAFLREPNFITALYLIDQTIIILFLMFRRPAQRMSDRKADYLIAAAGTLVPLFAVPSSLANIAPMGLCVALALAGILLHLGAKLSLRRSFGIVAADRGIKVEGAYRFIRHPMYLGYMMVHLSLLLAGPLLWNVIVFGVCWVLLVLRISAEERFLCGNEAYAAFQCKTRFRLIPGIY